MARGYFVMGEAMTYVKGRADSAIGTLVELGLTSDPIQIQIQTHRRNIRVDAFGDGPPESQFFGAGATIAQTLVHFDKAILNTCLQEAWGSSPAFGTMGHAGSLMGNNLPRFGPGGALGNHFIGLNIASAAGQIPWRFYFTALADNPMVFPLGTEKSLVQLNWQAFPYSQDPWNGGNGSFGVPIWDHVLDQ